MQTIALKQGIDRIRIYNSAGQVMFSTASEEAHNPAAAKVDLAYCPCAPYAVATTTWKCNARL